VVAFAAQVGAEAAAESADSTLEAADLVYSVNRTPERPFDTTRAVEVIDSEEIWRRNARTLPELLMECAGVFVQQTNYGGGSPVIRGLVGKQVLIFVDGVRLNNATYRFGPLQYLNTIDLAIVERIEIVRGVESVLGSDSLAGLINIITKKGPPVTASGTVAGRVSSRFSTADTARTGRAEAYGRTEKLRYVVGATLRQSDDLEVGGGGTTAATGYGELAGNFRLEYSPDATRAFHLSYLGLEQDDVPRTDRILDGTALRFDFDPQRIQLATLGYQDLTARGWADSVEATLYLNRQSEGRSEVRVVSPGTERQHWDQQTVWGANMQFASLLASHRLIWGAESSTEAVDSRREDVNLATGSRSTKRGQFTDGASYRSFAAYVQDRVTLAERLTLSLGGRLSHYEASGSERTSVGELDLGSSFTGVTGSASASFRASPWLNVVGGLTRGFRAPNMDDLSVFDERADGTEVPNVELSPERSLGWETGVKVQTARLTGSAFYHRSSLNDLLVRTRGQVDGLSFFDLNGNGVQEGGEPNVLQKENLGEARVSGWELDFAYTPSGGVTLFGNYARTEGRDLVQDAPLTRIPPAFGTLGARVSRRALRGAPWLELVFSFAGDQRELSAADVADSRIGPGGTDGFGVLHLRGGFSVGTRFRASLAVENLTDERYRYHSSGIDRPGRQLVLGAEYRF
jgi:outer membrane receptor protein involved in Fe transport